MPAVDPNRIGLTGISWGGYTTCIVSGIDIRFRFAVPVYGCGFYDEMPMWKADFQKLEQEKAAKWTSLWDPKQYLPDATLPMLWVTGTNDLAFPLPSFQRSYRLPSSQRTLCVRIRMPHGHGGAGENPEEIRVFADSIVNNGAPLVQVEHYTIQGDVLSAAYAGPTPVAHADLIYTLGAAGNWEQREWESLPAKVDSAARTVSARVPAGATAAYLNLSDARECIVSTEHVVLQGARSSVE
jgi:hypothetical protein